MAVRKLSKDRQALANLAERANGIEIVDESMAELSLKIHEVYSKVITKYLDTEVVIQFNYLESLKTRSKLFKTKEQFRALVESDLEIMKAKGDKTRIEAIEYLMAKKVYRDVVLGKGKEFEYGQDLRFRYDDQEVRYGGYFDLDAAKKIVN